jgi:peptide/nickel transport system permease protein
MSSKTETKQELAFQGLREKIPWHIASKDAVLRNPNMLIGLIFISMVVILALLAPLLIKVGILRDPYIFDPLNRLLPPGRSPDGDLFLFGTGPLGRDIFSMVIYGSRISLVVGLSVAILAASIGTMIGILAGYFSKLDDIIMRFMDGIMAIPGILLAIVLMAILGPKLENVIIALTVVDAPRTSRIVRSVVLTIRESQYVDAANAFGASKRRILFRHIAPNTFAPVIVQATFLFASAILSEASLSFLGAGVPPDIPTWGNIIGEGRIYFIGNANIVILPSLGLFFLALAVNMFGDGLRDSLDPKLRGKT